MPRWILSCPNCDQDYIYFEIREEPPTNLWFVDKPEMPAQGLSLECSNCKKTSTYLRHQLIYRA
jgi:hypothetical protein